MCEITLLEFESNPTGLLERVEAGERIVVVRGGRPVAELRPVATPRPFGLCRGQFVVPDDFDAPLPEDVLKEFEGR